MKIIIVILLSGFTTLVASQTSVPQFNRWSLDGGFGGIKALNPYSPGYSSNSISLPSFELGGRYMFDAYSGVRLEMGYSQIKYDQFGSVAGSGVFHSNYFLISAEGVLNLGQLLDFNTIHHRLGLLGYAGFGFSTLFNETYKLGNKTGSDEMLHFIVGLSPQFRLTNRLALSMNFKAIANMHQTRTFDLGSAVEERGLDGFIYKGTIGVSYYLGKQVSHYDWNNETDLLTQQINQKEHQYDSIVEAMKDSDNDGVPNYLDQEIDSAPDAIVSVKGVTIHNLPDKIDITESEIIDGYVELPELTGLLFTVQIGCYDEIVDMKEIYGLSPVILAKIRSGQTRYLYGIYTSLAEAEQIKDIVFERGVIGAHVTAYYEGKRITLAQAQKLLIDHGNIILQQFN